MRERRRRSSAAYLRQGREDRRRRARLRRDSGRGLVRGRGLRRRRRRPEARTRRRPERRPPATRHERARTGAATHGGALRRPVPCHDRRAGAPGSRRRDHRGRHTRRRSSARHAPAGRGLPRRGAARHAPGGRRRRVDRRAAHDARARRADLRRGRLPRALPRAGASGTSRAQPPRDGPARIALANQLAIISDHAGVDVRKVREQINRLWAAEPLILEPGAGVGGHCLPKDPWLLVSGLPADASRALVEGARALNESMPAHASAIVARALGDAGVVARGARVAVLGLTYEANSDDERNAPGPRVAAELERSGMTVVRHDPFVTKDDVVAALRGADAVVVVVPHARYREADWDALGAAMRHRVFVDCRRAFEADALRGIGFKYRALGVAALR
ncbi:MAG: hypothetical protein E6I57_03305 [Chloroflexi bacterium]|nr:MAG: hypothetical protein E6I57_03305 [Chloroflexota bacterium]